MRRKFTLFVVYAVSPLLVLLMLPGLLGAAGAPAAPRTPEAPAVAGVDDRENSTPTGWSVYSGQTVANIVAYYGSNNVRIVDLDVETTTAPIKFTVTYVANTGAYSKAWWWYVDVDAATLSSHLSANNARLTVLKAWDSGGGVIHFAAVMVSNTGADAKAWWWYYNQSIANVTAAWQANSARLVQVHAYTVGAQTYYAVVMISNTGADASGWWWYVGQSVGNLSSFINSNNARLIDLDRNPDGSYNAIMTSCGTDCPLWWWYVGSTAQQLLDNYAQNGSRIIDAMSYDGCGGRCYSYVMINNANAVTTRVGQLLRNGTDGVKGLYLKEVNGPVLANLEDAKQFEPASAIKAVLHVYAMRQVQNGAASLSGSVNRYQPPLSGSCPGNTVNGTETLSVALGEMMRHSDNTRTREISDTFGVNNIIGYAQSFGMNSTSINHVIGCGGPIPNQTTLDDLGTLYEKVANGTLLTPTNRTTFFSLMAGKAEYQLEGYDWTGLWTTDIPKIINQEAPPGMPGVLTQTFMSRMDLAYKAGNYKICGATCATYVDHIAIAGWAQIPFCTGPASSKQYVFGLFINNATSDTNSGNTFNATKAELLREQIRDGLASCYQRAFLPIIRR
ncbi:MAG: serine hydrolase [Chloroflexi bacterium]|nr:serine hydrolase [Chloroflexota bacterium]